MSLLTSLQEPDQLFEVISQSLLNAQDRDALAGWGGIVHIMYVFVLQRSSLTFSLSYGVPYCMLLVVSKTRSQPEL